MSSSNHESRDKKLKEIFSEIQVDAAADECNKNNNNNNNNEDADNNIDELLLMEKNAEFLFERYLREEENDDDEDLYMSDIHVENLPIDFTCETRLEKCVLCKSRIRFFIENATALPQPLNEKEQTNATSKLDKDGDLEVKRLKKMEMKKYELIIEHHLETTLANVGFQCWKGSLYLCDFLIDNRESLMLKERNVCELGAGLGIASFISALFANRVYCTDLEDVVRLAEKNFKANKSVLKSVLNKQQLEETRIIDEASSDLILDERIRFKTIDWSANEHLFLQQPAATDKHEYCLNAEDINYLKSANLIIAADVVYDNDLTHLFLNTLYKLLTSELNQPKQAFIALEKRINFELDEMRVSSSAYDYFSQAMNELNGFQSENNIKFKTEILNCTKTPQFMLNYNRNEFLFIWKISTHAT